MIWPLQNQSQTGLLITAKDLQGFSGYKEAKIPFWSHANGMKRYHLVHLATRQADGSYAVTNQKPVTQKTLMASNWSASLPDAKVKTSLAKAFIDFKNQSRQLLIS